MPTPTRPVTTGPAALPWGLLAGFFLVLSSSLGLLYWLTPPEAVHQLRATLYARNEMPEFVLALTPARYAWLRSGLLAAALVSGVGLLRGWRTGRLGPEWRALGSQGREVVGQLGRGLRRLSGPERGVAGLVLAAILGLRLYYFRVYPLWTDEVATFDYFVRGAPLSSTSFYPIPNNHVLFSLSCWVVSWFTQNDVLILRLPTLLISLLSTVLSFVVLLRLTSFRVALLAVALFCFSPMGMYYAFAGRGYFLLVSLGLGQFFAMLAVLHFPRFRLLAWGGFVMTGVLGLYTIPTYAYPLVSLGLWMALVLSLRRNVPGLLTLLVASGLVGAGALLLYSPLVCVSGGPALVGNQYVTALTAPEFWSAYAAYLRQPARELFGHETLSVAAFLAVVLAAVGTLPWLPRPWQRLAAPALLLVLMPFLLMPLQRVYAPARVLLYATFFLFVAAGLAFDWLLLKIRLRARPAALVVGLLALAYGAYQTRLYRFIVRNAQVQDQRLTSAYAWLRQQQPRRVFFQAPFQKLYFHHYASLEKYPLQLFEASSGPGTRYDLVVVAHQLPTPIPWLNPTAYRPVYIDAWVTIYAPGPASTSPGNRPPDSGN